MMKLFKKKSTLPKIHWKDITIARHKAILNLYESRTEEEDPQLFAYDLVCAVYGKDEEWINNLKVSEANDYVNTLAFVTEKPKHLPAKKSYILNGKKYCVGLNMQNLTTAQYIDFQQLYDKSNEMPAEFLSVIMVPEGHKYNDGYDINEVISDIENNLSVEEGLGLSDFFISLLRMSMRRSIRSLRKLERKAEKEGLMSKEQLDALKRVRQMFESANGLKP